jgi:hypothetical protein
VATDITEDELRVRYLDWCSTQVAKRFLELSLDDVWLRSNDAASAPPAGPSSDEFPHSFTPLDRIPDYLGLVRKTTLQLAREMDLPQFAEWREQYLADPTSFAGDILGG